MFVKEEGAHSGYLRWFLFRFDVLTCATTTRVPWGTREESNLNRSALFALSALRHVYDPVERGATLLDFLDDLHVCGVVLFTHRFRDPSSSRHVDTVVEGPFADLLREPSVAARLLRSG